MDRERVEALDGRDPLARFRERFVFAGDPDVIYLDGNSLGRMPVAAREAITSVTADWAERLVAGWDDWLDLPRRTGDRLGAVALGAAAGQTLLCDSTTVNLYKLASAALDGLSRPGATRIVTDAGNFPTDRYVLEGLAKQRGLTLELIDADELHGPGVGDVDPQGLALLVLSHVGYRSGAVADIGAVTEAAAGAPVVWDLSHSVGAMPIDLDGDGVQLAVGCTYKYVNGGPGAPAFLYVRRELQERLRTPVQGWFGQHDQFAMDRPYEPEHDIRRFLAGTPSILQLAAVGAAVELLGELGLDAIRSKSTALTGLMIELYDEWLAPLGFGLAAPRDATRRGSHVCLRHPEAQALIGELTRHGVIGDFRGPDRLRFGFAAPYTRFVDVYDAMARLRTLAEGRR